MRGFRRKYVPTLSEDRVMEIGDGVRRGAVCLCTYLKANLVGVCEQR